jgi:hypothetical protein
MSSARSGPRCAPAADPASVHCWQPAPVGVGRHDGCGSASDAPQPHRANGVTVALSATGTLSATYSGEAGPGATTHLIFDVAGYFVP